MDQKNAQDSNRSSRPWHSTILISILYLLWILPGFPYAASPEQSDIVITATRTPSKISHAGQTVRVLHGRHLAQLGIATLKDALNQLSGMTLVDAGGLQSLHVRGLASHHYKILLDGVDLKDAASVNGTAILDAISIANVSRIEIVQGGLGALHGSGAMGGVINIITSQDEERSQASLDLGYGQDIQRAAIRAQYANPSTQFRVSGSLDRNELQSRLANTSEKDLNQVRHYTGVFKQRFGTAQLQLSYTNSRVDQDLDKFFGGLDDPDYQSVKTYELGRVALRFPILDHIDTTAFYERTSMQRRDTDPTSNAMPFSSASHFNGLIESIGITALAPLSESAELLAGIERNDESSSSSFSSKQIQHIYAAYLNGGWINDILSVRAAGRLQRYSEDKFVQTSSLSVFRRIPLLDIQWRSTIQTAHRDPSLFEKLNPTFGNSKLSAETGITRELSFERHFGTVLAGVTFYEHDIQRKIQFLNGRYHNVTGNTVSRGTDYFIALNKQGPLDFLRFEYTQSAASSGGIRSARIPSHKYTLSSGFSEGPWTLGHGLIHMGERADTNSASSVILPAYTLHNLRIGYTLSPSQTLYLTVNNVFDTDHQEVSGYARPGRHAVFGYTLTM